jgi:TatD DNase family protein
VAVHPTEASRLAAAGTLDAALADVERLAGSPRIGVVGETGLDHYWVGPDDAAGRAAQRESFGWHVDLAKRLGKVLQVHDRDAHAEVLDLLAAEGAPDRTVLHCFSGDVAMARDCADRGWVLSFAGTLTFRNAPRQREALAAVPLEQVLVETDAPYLAPVPARGRPNASYLLPYTVRCLAEVIGRDLADVCATLSATFHRVYGP